MLAALAVAAALAAPPDRPVTVSGGPIQAAGPGAFGGGIGVRAIGHVGRLGIEVGSRDGYLAGSERILGSVSAGVRLTPRRGPHVRIAFLHHHETPRDLARVYPLQTLLGSLSGIAHRTGLEVGTGVDVPVFPRRADGRFGVSIDLAVGAFPDSQGPTGYVFFEQAFTLDLGPRRASSEVADRF